MKVLHVLSDLDNGGVAHILYDYCTRLFNKIEFDFAVSSENVGMIEKQLINLGCRIYHIPQIRGNLKKRNTILRKIIKCGRYDIVHDHSDYKGIFTMIIAKQCNVKTRIVHSHRTVLSESQKHIFFDKFLISLTKHFATNLCACGIDAAVGIWGCAAYQNGRVQIVRNGIDISKFNFSSSIRAEYRKKLGIEGKIAIGNIGRFAYQKNHEFLIEVFKVLKEQEKKAVLVLIGNGEDERKIRNMVETYGLTDDVLFLGSRDDVPKLLSALDVFVLPSRYEGLPIVLVEVQANGLPAVVADTVTTEVSLLDNLKYLSLESSPQQWKNAILNLVNNRIENVDALQAYNIEVNVLDLEEFYKECVKNN